jgi:hypothetical protein
VLLLVESSSSSLAPPPPPVWKCTAHPPSPRATDARRLRPADIQAVMAVGDSMTAGFGMHSGHWSVNELIEYRGDVYSIGGNPGQYTIPNFLKTYNPNVQGAAIGQSVPLDAVKWQNHIIQPFDPKISHLNAAQSQARIDAVPAQVNYLVDQLKTTYKSSVDFKNDWKLLTILIGANNLCPACENRTDTQPDYYEAQMQSVLNQVYNSIPRVFVNIITMFNISQVWDIHMTSDYCRFMWDEVTSSECGCLTDHTTEKQRKMMDEAAVKFNQRLYKIEDEWRAKNLSEFNVVVQPFFQNLVIPGIDFVSELDCFHPSADADLGMAVSLWNNMMTPPGKKATNIPLDLPDFICPGPNDYLQ